MSTHTLELRLKAFRLPSFLAHYGPLADQAAEGGWSHTLYLEELAAVEAVERAERRIARLLSESKLARDKTMATLDTERFPAPVRTQIARLAEALERRYSSWRAKTCSCPSCESSSVS